uniref:THD domain-containing protein n=1 Tax=Magallana gigas TaxID=29159 RepID=A0A8W8IU12_MAGGI
MAQDDCSSHCLDDEKYSEVHNKKLIGRSVIFSFAVNVFFLGVVFCWVVLQIVGDHRDHRDDLQGPSQAPSLPEDSFYSCSPCKPMMRADDADTMRLATGNSSLVCCKRISPDVQLELPNTGQLLEECQAKQGLHWKLGRETTYKKGGVVYEDSTHYGKLTVPSDGVYAVYSYIQFDSYTGNSKLDHPKPEMHVLYKNGNQLLQMNKFMLRQHSYITSQVGPILVELKARDWIHVAVGSMGRFIHNNPQSSVFGLYKL